MAPQVVWQLFGVYLPQILILKLITPAGKVPMSKNWQLRAEGRLTQTILEIDGIHMEDRNHGLAWTKPRTKLNNAS